MEKVVIADKTSNKDVQMNPKPESLLIETVKRVTQSLLHLPKDLQRSLIYLT